MPKKILEQLSFNAGELSPRLYSRSDVGKYDNGLSTATNCKVTPHGPVIRRQGTQYVAEVENSDDITRLARFQLNESTAIILSFGDETLRFYTNRGIIQQPTISLANTTFDSDITSWTDVSTGTGSISWNAGNQSMNLVGTDGSNVGAAQQSENTVRRGIWKVTLDVVGSVTLDISDTSGGSGTYGSLAFSAGTGQTAEFNLTKNEDTLWFIFRSETTSEVDNIVIEPVAHQIATPYSSSEVADITYTQSGNSVYIAHPDYEPRVLTRTADDNWDIDTLGALPTPTYEAGKTSATIDLTLGATTGLGITCTAGSALFLLSDVGRQIVNLDGPGRASIIDFTTATSVTVDIVEDFDRTSIDSADWRIDLSPVADLEPSGTVVGSIIRLDAKHPSGSLDDAKTITGITNANPGVVTTSAAHGYIDGDTVRIDEVVGMTQLNGQTFVVDNKTSTTFQLFAENTTSYPTYASGGKSRLVLTDTELDTFKSEDVGKFILINGGVVEITKFVDATEVEGEVLKSLNSKDRSGNWSMEVDTWDATRGFPRAVGIFEERLIFGGTTAQPETVWMSETGIFTGFGVGPDDEDSIQIDLGSSYTNEINWIAVGKDLIIGTSGSEVTIDSGNSSTSGVTPTSIRQQIRSFIGGDQQQTVAVGHETIFIQNAGRKLRSFRFDFNIDGYISEDLLFLAEHMSEIGIKEIAYSQDPDSQIYAVLNDGDMLVGTYVREQEVIGWTRFTTDGSFESVQSITEGANDEVYVIVNRTIDGATKRYIEVFDTEDGTDRLDGFSDSFLTYSAPKTITGATQADPVVITATAHGYSNGDDIKIIDVVGMTELNGKSYLVANKTANTFEITDLDGNDIDGTGFTAYSSGGEAHELVDTISGLDHLEGETVQIKADGAAHADKTVSSGAITLDNSSYEVTVGLPYTTTIKTLDLAFDIGFGGMQGQRARWVKPQMRLYRSDLPLINGEFRPTRDTNDEMDEAVDLTSGIVCYGNLAWSNSSSLTITESDPLPLVITGIFGTIDSGVK